MTLAKFSVPAGRKIWAAAQGFLGQTLDLGTTRGRNSTGQQFRFAVVLEVGSNAGAIDCQNVVVHRVRLITATFPEVIGEQALEVAELQGRDYFAAAPAALDLSEGDVITVHWWNNRLWVGEFVSIACDCTESTGCDCEPVDEVITWEDDKDFASIRDLSGLVPAGTFDEGTGHLWRIVAGAGGTDFDNYSTHFDEGEVMMVGPMVGSTMYGPFAPNALGGILLGSRFNPPVGDPSADWWYWYGEFSTSPPRAANAFNLQVGCVCNCACGPAGEPEVKWPGEDPRAARLSEKTAIFWTGDRDDPQADEGICTATSGLAFYGRISGNSGSCPRTPLEMRYTIENVAGQHAADLGAIESKLLEHNTLDNLDVVFVDTCGGGIAGQVNSSRNPSLSNDDIDALKTWLDLGNKTLVLSVLRYHQFDLSTTGPTLDLAYAESTLGVEILPTRDRPLSSTTPVGANAVSHVLATGLASFSVRDWGLCDGFTTGTTLYEATMDFADGAETVPVVVLHDVGSGSRIIVGTQSYKTYSGFSSGFLGMLPDAFMSRVITERGNY